MCSYSVINDNRKCVKTNVISTFNLWQRRNLTTQYLNFQLLTNKFITIQYFNFQHSKTVNRGISQFLTSDKAGKVKAIVGVGRPRARGEIRRRAITTWEIDSHHHQLEWEINHLHEEKLNCQTLDQFRNYDKWGAYFKLFQEHLKSAFTLELKWVSYSWPEPSSCLAACWCKTGYDQAQTHQHGSFPSFLIPTGHESLWDRLVSKGRARIIRKSGRV